MDQGGLFLDPGQAPGLGQKIVIQVQCGFHMYQYGCFGHTPQAAPQQCDGRRATLPVTTALCDSSTALHFGRVFRQTVP